LIYQSTKKEVNKMTTRRLKEQTATRLEAGMLGLTDADVLPGKAVLEIEPHRRYGYRYTTGPFIIPQNSGSLDWILLNNAATQQKVRVTVYKCPVGAVKTPVAPGPLVVTLDPGESTHNANTYPAGFAYEVQVECISHLVFPYVSVWPGNIGDVIPGTGINSGSFLRQMP
jgi:hypothetical protein